MGFVGLSPFRHCPIATSCLQACTPAFDHVTLHKQKSLSSWDMHHCLKTSEIVRTICSQLDDNAKERALSMALACRDFLEPGLDRLWHTIDSMDPILARLPENLWRTDGIQANDDELERIVMVRIALLVELNVHLNQSTLTTVLTKTDCNPKTRRETSFCARQTREISRSPADWRIGARPKSLSIKGWQALQVATRHEQGALPPLLKTCSWPLMDEGANHSLAPFMPLILDPVSKRLHFGDSGIPMPDSI